MRRFLLKAFSFWVLQAALLALLLRHYDVALETNYLAATLEKHRRLNAVPPPRVILVGGSNVALGFESDRIERELGRPVVNLGLAAGLGVEFMLAEIEPALRAGDLVVLSLEYDHFARGPKDRRYSGAGFDPNVLQQALIFRPAGVVALGLTHLRKIVLDRGLAILGEIARRGFAVQIEQGMASQRNGEIQSERRAFNVWGDFVGHRGAPPRATPEMVDAGRLIADARAFPNSALLEVIRGFVDRNARRGIQTVFTFPPKPTGVMRRESALALRLAGALRQIPGLVLLDTPEDQAYPPEQFFDTANHLTAEGTTRRTTRVIESLRRVSSNRR